MPGTPFIYYGDELAMKTMPLDSKDGGYQRTGVRIPMIWNDKLPYHGFSNTKGKTYLPFYDEVNKVSVESASKDDNSLYNFIKKMIKVRKGRLLKCLFFTFISKSTRFSAPSKGQWFSALRLTLTKTEECKESCWDGLSTVRFPL